MLFWNPLFSLLFAGWLWTSAALPEVHADAVPPDLLHITKTDDSELPGADQSAPSLIEKEEETPSISEIIVPVATPMQTAPPVATETTSVTTAVMTEEVPQTTESTPPEEASPQPAEETEPASAAAQEMLDTQETWFKAYMDYRTITNTASEQYELQQQAWTDSQGLRRIGDDYMVAMGTGWLEEGCGERFLVTLETGESFTVIIGDIKDDRHTDADSLYHWCDCGANVLEFIVDTDAMSSEVRHAGTISAYDAFAGNITEISRIAE